MANLAKNGSRIVRRTLLGSLAATVGAYVVGIEAAGLLIVAGLPRLPFWGAILLGEVIVGGIVLASVRSWFRRPDDRKRLVLWRFEARFAFLALAYEGFNAYSGLRVTMAHAILFAATVSGALAVMEWIKSSMQRDQGEPLGTQDPA